MRDIGGFVALLLIVFVVLYLAVRYVVPFVLLYSAGIVLFFIAAGLIMRKGLRHPVHLDCYLKPGYAPVLVLLAVVLPLLHATLVYSRLDRGVWLVAATVNLLVPVIWVVRVGLLHMKQAGLFLSQGHDVEETLELARSRADLLALKVELLSSAGESHGAPEQWEIDAGIVRPDEPGANDRISGLILEMNQLRDAYLSPCDDLQAALDSIRGGSPRDDGAITAATSGIRMLDGTWISVSAEATNLLNERTGYAPPGWD